jgi:hypothetical protein
MTNLQLLIQKYQTVTLTRPAAIAWSTSRMSRSISMDNQTEALRYRALRGER